LNILAHRPAPTFRSYFGDYRPSSSQAIGVGDTVQVTVWEAASGGLFSAPIGNGVAPGSRSASIPDQIVGRDGSITVPYAGRVHAAGRSPQQVERAIVSRLMGKAIEPQAVVNVSRNVSNTVTVEGDVNSGARVPLTLRGDRILDVIASAGGYRSPAHETFVNLTRGGRTGRAPLQALLDNPREDIYVRPGDIINVERAPQTYTVVGATGANAVETFGAKTVTLEEAIAKAGGLSDGRADPAGVYLLRYEPSSLVSSFANVPPALLSRKYVPVAYHVDMRDPAALFAARRFVMRDKDILYVSNAPLAEIGKAAQLFQTLSQPAIQAFLVARVVK
ncbi:MAG: polysaccharide export protein, partial [Methylocystis sp.]|nr:polysaccharide export protein [Methylocystis sp.]